MAFEDRNKWEADTQCSQATIEFALPVATGAAYASKTLFSRDFDRYYTETIEGVGVAKELSVKATEGAFEEERAVLITPEIGLFGTLAEYYTRWTGHDAISYTTTQRKSYRRLEDRHFLMEFVNEPSAIGPLGTINNWGTISIKETDEDSCVLATELRVATYFIFPLRMLNAHGVFVDTIERETTKVFRLMLDALVRYKAEYTDQGRLYLQEDNTEPHP